MSRRQYPATIQDRLVRFNGVMEGRHICNLLNFIWSNFCNSAYNFASFLPMLGHQFINDGEIDEKHVLQIIVPENAGKRGMLMSYNILHVILFFYFSYFLYNQISGQ